MPADEQIPLDGEHTDVSGQVLRAYAKALTERNAAAAAALFDTHALFELPLLGQRLVGKREIQAGLDHLLAVTERFDVEINGVRAAAGRVIAEGILASKLRRDHDLKSRPVAMVLEEEEGRISRLSVYLDSRHERPWVDGPIFGAAPGPAATV